MRKIIKALWVLTIAIFIAGSTVSCEADQPENDIYAVDKDEVVRPGDQGDAVDKDEVERPGDQGNN